MAGRLDSSLVTRHLTAFTQADRVPHAVCFQPVVPNDAVPA